MPRVRDRVRRFRHPRSAARGDQAAVVGRGARAYRKGRGAASADAGARARASKRRRFRRRSGSRRSSPRSRSAIPSRRRRCRAARRLRTDVRADRHDRGGAVRHATQNRSRACSRRCARCATPRRCPIALRDGKLPLPLDLLARHRLCARRSRGSVRGSHARAARMVRRIWRRTCARCSTHAALAAHPLGHRARDDGRGRCPARRAGGSCERAAGGDERCARPACRFRSYGRPGAPRAVRAA